MEVWKIARRFAEETAKRSPSMGFNTASRNVRILQNTLNLSTISSPSSHHTKQISLANLFQTFGFPSSLAHNRFLFNFDFSTLRKSLATLVSFPIPHKNLVSLVRICPAVLEYPFLKDWEFGFSQLKSRLPNPSPLMLVNLLQCSARLQLDPVQLFHKLEVFRVLGFSEAAMARVLEGFPTVLVMSERQVVSVVEFLTQFGLHNDEIDRVVRLYPNVLGLGVEDMLRHLIQELRDLGFSGREIREEIVRDPRILGMEIGEFSWCLRLLESLKCREAIKDRVLGEGLVRACFEVKRRVDCLSGHGLIRRDAFKVLWKEPRLIIYDVEDIEKKILFLVHKMKFNVDCLPDVPEYLAANFEKQIVPRYNVIEYLIAKDAIGFEVGLKDIIKPTRFRFYDLYVKPYPECEKIYGRFSEKPQVKRKHPAGLWKLLKPQKFPETDEDAKNMKAFMDSLV